MTNLKVHQNNRYKIVSGTILYLAKEKKKKKEGKGERKERNYPSTGRQLNKLRSIPVKELYVAMKKILIFIFLCLSLYFKSFILSFPVATSFQNKLDSQHPLNLTNEAEDFFFFEDNFKNQRTHSLLPSLFQFLITSLLLEATWKCFRNKGSSSKAGEGKRIPFQSEKQNTNKLIYRSPAM